MPTRKQRRRRAKEQRHEYVWEDAEGNEIDAGELPSSKAKQSPRRESTSRGAREVQRPSWRRTLKRGLVFAPIMFGTVYLLSPNLPLQTKITQTALLVAIFVPFSYVLDGVFYRSYKRRLARQQQPDGRRGS